MDEKANNHETALRRLPAVLSRKASNGAGKLPRPSAALGKRERGARPWRSCLPVRWQEERKSHRRPGSSGKISNAKKKAEERRASRSHLTRWEERHKRGRICGQLTVPAAGRPQALAGRT